MSIDKVKFEEIKTKAHAARYLMEQCTETSLTLSIITYFVGVAGFPIIAKRFGRQVQYMNEYSVFIGAVSMMFVSYGVGVFTKAKCEESVNKELHKLVLED